MSHILVYHFRNQHFAIHHSSIPFQPKNSPISQILPAMSCHITPVRLTRLMDVQLDFWISNAHQPFVLVYCVHQFLKFWTSAVD